MCIFTMVLATPTLGMISGIKDGKTDRGYAKRSEVNNSNRLNFCFRDSSGNWDNNKGVNWSFGVHGGKKI